MHDYALPWKVFAVLVRYNRQRLYYEKALKFRNSAVRGVKRRTSAVDLYRWKRCMVPAVSRRLYAGLAEKLTPNAAAPPGAENATFEERRLLRRGDGRKRVSFAILL